MTKEFFEKYIRAGIYDAFVSDLVAREIGRTSAQGLRELLLSVISEYQLAFLETTEEAEKLADEYIEDGVLSPKYRDDAVHVAIATCNHIDVLLSWNVRHLANIQKQIAVRSTNARNGYLRPSVLTNPMEMFYERE